MKMETFVSRSWTVNLIVLLLIALIFTSCGDGTVDVTIENKGTRTLKSVTLEVRGNPYELGDIEPDASKSVEVEVVGESHIELGQAGRDRLIVEVYIEPGYGGSVHVFVTPDTVLSIKNNIDIVDIIAF